MHESLLQFIWQYSLYNPSALRSQDGEEVTVQHPGMLNRDAGPDFTKARVRIGSTVLVGHVELHVRSSEWARHGHSGDPAYRNLVLHVVYEDDTPGAAGPDVPVLELRAHIPAYVLDRYTYLLHTAHHIPCESQHDLVPQLTKDSWLSRMLAERWEARLTDWQTALQACGGDWRTVVYWRLAAAFGGKVNGETFLALARSLPLALLEKHRHSLPQLEALLYGQAGMLESPSSEEYPQALQQEYTFLRKKYSLTPIAAHLWKFMRMRPASFPTVRIAQFAALIYAAPDLISQLLTADLPALMNLLSSAQASPYWQTHYRFGEEAARRSIKSVGEDAVQTLLINAVAPMRFLYAHHQASRAAQEAALALLEGLAPEDNNIIREWRRVGWAPRNAADSQAQLQLYNQYCAPKRCLECAVGLSIIRRRPVE